MLHTSDFDFELPTELIASHPLEKRDASRMLVIDPNKFRPHGEEDRAAVEGVADKHIRDFLDYLRPGDVVVFNNSRVIPARFMATRGSVSEQGASRRSESEDGPSAVYEITLHTSVNDRDWWGLCKKFNKINIGDTLTMDDGTTITVIDKDEESGLLLHFNCDNIFDVLNNVGKMPLPPYMKREEELSDRERYQTVYADPLGSMAAPTAGLHFTDELMSEIEKRGAKIVKITLHVGAGTWMPVKTENLDEHKMHSEWCCITPEQADIINDAKRVIAVGKTSMRTLESAHQLAIQQMAEQKFPSWEGCPNGTGWAKRQINASLPQNSKLKQYARELRKAGSLPEALLWKEIKGKQINGLDFDRQHVIGNYIVDFFCPTINFVIEIDDKTHDFKGNYDIKRDKYLQSLGLKVMHIPASDVLQDPCVVVQWIKNYIDDIHTPPQAVPPSQEGNLVNCANDTKFPSWEGCPNGTGWAKIPRVLPICQQTDIFITPGYKFGAVDVLLTNFHLPKSTLFMLVSAFAGLPEMKSAYAHAVAEKYRFFSYGDCCLLFKKDAQ